MVADANQAITVQKGQRIQRSVTEESFVMWQGSASPKEIAVQVIIVSLRQAAQHLLMKLVVNVHLGITALRVQQTPSHVIQEHTMVEMVQLTQVHVYRALMAYSVIHLVLLPLMGGVRLDTIVHLGSQLALHLYMFVHWDISVLQESVVLQNVNLANTKTNLSKTAARNALKDTIAMRRMAE